jgi:VIT1/CCC1 family predicted Fe2+/Mn2+ transporter
MREIYIRNIIFGVADSLVSTVGLLSGIDVSGSTRSIIILTGVVYAFVEAFSMAVGSFLSEESTEEFETKTESFDRRPYVGAAVMFVTFVVASFIPIAPYLFLSIGTALWVSIAFSIIALFIVGIVIAKVSEIKAFKHGLKMVLLGGAAILIGVIVGKLIKTS